MGGGGGVVVLLASGSLLLRVSCQDGHKPPAFFFVSKRSCKPKRLVFTNLHVSSDASPIAIPVLLHLRIDDGALVHSFGYSVAAMMASSGYDYLVEELEYIDDQNLALCTAMGVTGESLPLHQVPPEAAYPDGVFQEDQRIGSCGKGS